MTKHALQQIHYVDGFNTAAAVRVRAARVVHGRHGAIATRVVPSRYTAWHQGAMVTIRRVGRVWRVDGSYQSHATLQSAVDTVGAP